MSQLTHFRSKCPGVYWNMLKIKGVNDKDMCLCDLIFTVRGLSNKNLQSMKIFSKNNFFQMSILLRLGQKVNHKRKVFDVR